MDSESLVIAEVKNAKSSEETPQVMEQVFAAFAAAGHHGAWWHKFFGPRHSPKWASFEIVSVNSGVHFFLVTTTSLYGFFESQLLAQYPSLSLARVDDYLPHFLSLPHKAEVITLSESDYLPLKTYKDVKDVDLLSSLLGSLSRLPQGEAVAMQLRVSPAAGSWQSSGMAMIARGVPDVNFPGRTKTHPQTRLIEAKLAQPGLATSMRLITVAPELKKVSELTQNVVNTLGVYVAANGLSLGTVPFWQKAGFTKAVAKRGVGGPTVVLGATELASLWHPPGLTLSNIKNIAWGVKLTGEPPENLPVVTDEPEEKRAINFFARTEYKNQPTTFGIKREDRRKHVYIVGKTGTGKSTMIANMVINDMRNGEGVAVIDPHGDLCDVLLDFVPANRINDVAYLDPSDIEHPFYLNPFEVKDGVYKELVASGIVSIFYKLYSHSWGPRLEYILRNTILTLLSVPGTTLLQVPEILTNESYRQKVVEKMTDQVLKNFWLNEFNKMPPQMKSEAVSPILNKVGQFLSSQTIRNIVGHPTSTIDLESMMNEGKIILVNLSQGKLGEDASALLGAMLITKIQLAAMNRVHVSESERKDFFMYVDEFQTFATTSFIKILSEARKYRLNLTLANQYVGQVDEEVQKAIFGNAGSLVSFAVGGVDARMLSKEFGLLYKEEELVGLGNYQIILKLSIDNQACSPFSATTLPLPRSRNQNRAKVIRSSRERYTKGINPKS